MNRTKTQHFKSALRTVLACTIIGCTTLYGPNFLSHVIAFPAFSYLTAVLILADNNATLGDTLRGSYLALHATCQVMLLSISILWATRFEKFTGGLAVAAVVMSTFVVALPEWTDILCKRIAFGQIIVVFVGAVVNGEESGHAFMHHPIQVAASTGLGVAASVLATLVPFPRLAYYEVKKTCKDYAENSLQRLNIFVEALACQDKTAELGLLSLANYFSARGTKLLEYIKDKQVGMKWERPQIGFLSRNSFNPGEELEAIELLFRGMDLALTSSKSIPIRTIDEELNHVLQISKEQIGLKLEQVKSSSPSKSTDDKQLWNIKTISLSDEDLPGYFFCYCMELLQGGSFISQTKKIKIEYHKTEELKDQGSNSWKRFWDVPWISSERLIFALKCSISLGLAVLFGLMFNKANAYWSGLTIAISFVTGRQPTFTVSNARAQGTAMGSVYGVLCYFIFQRFEEFRFLPLLPWIIFASFLRRSRMYGQAGGMAAIIGALLILGRKNYGAPTDFAITRITEATIGLICFMSVEIIFCPARAATLAKKELLKCLVDFSDCVKGIVLCPELKDITELRKNQMKFRSHIDCLKGFIAEAEQEPNFWFTPFSGTFYNKLHGSLSKTADLFLFVCNEISFLSETSHEVGLSWKEIQADMNNDLKLFQERVDYSLKCMKESILTRRKNVTYDIESGVSSNAHSCVCMRLDEEIGSSFLQHLKEAATKISINEGELTTKNQMILCLNALGFCISSLMREAIDINKELKELIKWENPTSQINLHYNFCKLNHQIARKQMILSHNPIVA